MHPAPEVILRTKLCLLVLPLLAAFLPQASFATHWEDTPLDFYTVAPCRVLYNAGQIYTLTLQSGSTYGLPIAGYQCGVPASAKAVALNLTVSNPAAQGNLTLWPLDVPRPATSSINFRAGEHRANNAILALSPDGHIGARTVLVTDGTVDLILDVTGYFE